MKKCAFEIGSAFGGEDKNIEGDYLKKSNNEKYQAQNPLAFGLGIGIALGSGIGILIGNLALGIGIGLAVSILFAAGLKKKKDKLN